MTDFSKLLNAVIGGDFTLEQLTELQSVLTEKQEVKEKKIISSFFYIERQNEIAIKKETLYFIPYVLF